MSRRLLDALAARPLLLDAGMGTRLIARGLDLRTDDTAFWNLSHPEVVRAIHGLDVDAGSDAILTNTFGANSAWLDRYGRAGEVAEINRRAVALARDAAGVDRFVLGSIGPTAADSAGAYRAQAEALAEAGADGLLLETHTLDRALVGLAEIRPVVDLPILVSLTSWGADPGRDALQMIEAGAGVLGINCAPLDASDGRIRVAGVSERDPGGMAPERGLGARPQPPGGRPRRPSTEPNHGKATPTARVVFRSIREVSPVPLLIKPCGQVPGGPPSPVGSYASAVASWLRWGVRLMGGCCGATEAHVAAMRSALDQATAGRV